MDRIRVVTFGAIVALAVLLLAPAAALADDCTTPVYSANGQIVLVHQSSSLAINTDAAKAASASALATSAAVQGADNVLISSSGSATIVAIAQTQPFSTMSLSASGSTQVYEVTRTTGSATIVQVVPGTPTSCGSATIAASAGASSAAPNNGSTLAPASTTTVLSGSNSSVNGSAAASVSGLPSTSTGTDVSLFGYALLIIGGALVLSRRAFRA